MYNLIDYRPRNRCKLADLSPIVEGANALYSVTDARMYANTDRIYAIFGAMGNQTLAVGNSSENIELPIEGELYSRGIILADINIDGTLNQKKVYESVNASTNDLQNVIGGHFGKRWQNCRSRVV